MDFELFTVVFRVNDKSQKPGLPCACQVAVWQSDSIWPTDNRLTASSEPRDQPLWKTLTNARADQAVQLGKHSPLLEIFNYDYTIQNMWFPIPMAKLVRLILFCVAWKWAPSLSLSVKLRIDFCLKSISEASLCLETKLAFFFSKWISCCNQWKCGLDVKNLNCIKIYGNRADCG